MLEIKERIAYAPEEVAEMLGISVAGVRARIRRGALPANRVGREWRIPASWVARFDSGEIQIVDLGAGLVLEHRTAGSAEHGTAVTTGVLHLHGERVAVGEWLGHRPIQELTPAIAVWVVGHAPGSPWLLGAGWSSPHPVTRPVAQTQHNTTKGKVHEDHT